jgi:hypothetical protein
LGISACENRWPGMGIENWCASALTLGKMRSSAAAAAAALGRPPSRQSANSYSDWRTGLEYATRPLSTSVMRRTPHPSSTRATTQPRVPDGRTFRSQGLRSAAPCACRSQVQGTGLEEHSPKPLQAAHSG